MASSPSNLPLIDASIPDDASKVEQTVLSICEQVLHGWSGLDKQPEVAPLGGGITNRLFKVTHPAANDAASNSQPPPEHAIVVVRKFGNDTDRFIDRVHELRTTVQLNAAGLGASILGTFHNGRVEAWLEARTLDSPEVALPSLVPLIARRIADFHAVPVDTDREPQLWSTIDRWLAMAEALTFDDESKAARHAALDWAGITAAISSAKALCARVASPPVFCHNDLLSGNILLLDVSPDEALPAVPPERLQVQLIDFEYAARSFRGFDLGNHFNEWAGFDCDWAALPVDAQQTAFLKAYLSRIAQLSNRDAPTAAEVQRARAEVTAYMQASHVYWGVWSLLQARYSKIDFDYFAYSDLRFARFHDSAADAERAVDAQFGDIHAHAIAAGAAA